MKRWRAIVALALLLVQSMAGLSEYAYMLKEEYPSLWHLLIFPQSCKQFKTRVELPVNLPIRKEFEEAYSLAQSAKTGFETAGGTAATQEAFAVIPDEFSYVFPLEPISKIPFAANRVLAYMCYSQGLSSLRTAVHSVKSGISSLDKNKAELEALYEASYSGVAGGVTEEFKEIEEDIQEGNKKVEAGGAFGKRFGAVVGSVNAVWESVREHREPRIRNAVLSLVGNDSLLRDEIVLNEKVRKAVEALWDEKREEEEKAARQLDLCELKVRGLEEEKLEYVSEEAFSFLQSEGILKGEVRVEPFQDELKNEKALIAEVKIFLENTKGIEKRRERGFLSKTILLLRDVNKKLERCIVFAEELNERSENLDAQLKNEIEANYLKLEKKYWQVKNVNPFAAALARDLLDEVERLGGKTIKARGDRISNYLKQVEKLHEAEKILGSSSPITDKKSGLVAKIKQLGETIKLAKKDLPSDYYEIKLTQLEKSVAEADENEGGIALLRIVETELESLENEVYADAFERYSLLGEMFEKLQSTKEFLDEGQQLKLNEYAQFFYFGEIDARKGLGKLKDIMDYFNKALGEIDVRIPLILKKHLEEKAEIVEETGVHRLNEIGETRFRLLLKNDLPLDYRKEIKLSIQLPSNLVITNKSPEIEVSDGKVFLTRVSHGKEYFLSGEYNESISKIISEKERTEFADQYWAEKTILVRFSASKDAVILITKQFDFPFEARVFSKLNLEYEEWGNELRTVAEARKGENEIEINYRIDNPISIEKNVSQEDGKTVFNYAFFNKYTELDNANINLIEKIACSEAEILSELKHEKEVSDGFLSLAFYIDEFRKHETKNVVVIAKCNSLETIAKEKLGEIELRLMGLEENGFVYEIARAKEEIGEKRFLEAIRLLEGIEKGIETEEGKNMEESEYERMLGNELNESENEIRYMKELAESLREEGMLEQEIEVKNAINEVEERSQKIREILRNKNWKEYENMEPKTTLVESILGKRVLSFEKECEGICNESTWEMLEEAKKKLALNDFLGTFKALDAAAKEIKDEKMKNEEAFKEKKKLLEMYSPARDNAKKAIEVFEAAFASEGTIRGSQLYSDGTKIKSTMQKGMKKLDEAWEALQSSDYAAFKKYSVEYVSAQLNELDENAKKLNEITNQLKEKAESEVSLAEGRQREFGGEETQKELDGAKEKMEAGSYYTAYAIAASLNKKLVGTPQVTTVGGLDKTVVLGAISLITLGALFLLFWKKPEKEMVEI